MNIKDYLFIVKHSLFEKRNQILFIILFFVFLAIFSILTFYHFIDYNIYAEHNDLNSRTLSIEPNSKEDLTKIRNIKHVVFIENGKYETLNFNTNSFNVNNNPGYISLIPLIDKNEITIKKGKGITKENEAICPINFYPHDIPNDKIIKKDYLKNNKALNKKFTITSNNKNYNFNIVGTYDPKEVIKSINTCYISTSDYNKIINNQEQNYYLVRIDKNENISYVTNELRNLGIHVATTIPPSNDNSIQQIVIFVTIIILFISYNIIYNFTKKKINYRLTKYGILKTTGYTNKKIKTDLLENIIITTMAFIISFIAFSIIYPLIINNISYLDFFVYISVVDLNISLKYILLSYILVILMIFLATKILLNIYLKRNIKNLLKEG